MKDYELINILDMIDAIGEEKTALILSDFSCPMNCEIENFVKSNAIDFAKRKTSITYLIVDHEGRIIAVFALTHKAIQILNDKLSSSMRKKIQRYAQLDEATSSYMLSAFLIAQFGKNFQYDTYVDINGNELMEITMSILKKVQCSIGGGIVYLECEDKPKLLSFYQNDANKFKIFGNRVSKSDNTKYIQLMKLF